ncbi:hypothetical protein LTR65_007748 [Meristemomyces frigidus]
MKRLNTFLQNIVAKDPVEPTRASCTSRKAAASPSPTTPSVGSSSKRSTWGSASAPPVSSCSSKSTGSRSFAAHMDVSAYEYLAAGTAPLGERQQAEAEIKAEIFQPAAEAVQAWLRIPAAQWQDAEPYGSLLMKYSGRVVDKAEYVQVPYKWEPVDVTATEGGWRIGEPKQALRLILPSCGGIYHFDSDRQGDQHVGFSGCYDSVGVYFAVGASHCFAANIDVRILTEGTDGIMTGRTVIPGDDVAVSATVQEEVYRRLEAASHRAGWPTVTGLMRDTLVTTGGWMSSASQDEPVQDGVVAAVQAFLGFPKEAGKTPEEEVALVVKRSGEIVERAEHWLTARKWNVDDTDHGRGDWQFGVSA